MTADTLEWLCSWDEKTSLHQAETLIEQLNPEEVEALYDPTRPTWFFATSPKAAELTQIPEHKLFIEQIAAGVRQALCQSQPASQPLSDRSDLQTTTPSAETVIQSSSVSAKPGTLEHLTQEVAERHYQFCQWFQRAKETTAQLRPNRFASFRALDQLPAVDYGNFEWIHQQNVKIPTGGRIEKSTYAFQLLKTFLKLIDDHYDGDYSLARGSSLELNLVVIRRLSCNHVTLFSVFVSLEGNSLTIRVGYRAYDSRFLPQSHLGIHYRDLGVYSKPSSIVQENVWPQPMLTESNWAWLASMDRNSSIKASRILVERPKNNFRARRMRDRKAIFGCWGILLLVLLVILNWSSLRPKNDGYSVLLALACVPPGIMAAMLVSVDIWNRIFLPMEHVKEAHFLIGDHRTRLSGLFADTARFKDLCSIPEHRIYVERLIAAINEAAAVLDQHFTDSDING